jgi:large subunit ribosomal protein L9
MKVILREDVKNLGQIGVIVNVSDGYARNYLIPKKLAIEANTKNIREIEHNKKSIMRKAARIKESYNAIAEKLSTITLLVL